jgi:hypothetical protein
MSMEVHLSSEKEARLIDCARRRGVDVSELISEAVDAVLKETFDLETLKLHAGKRLAVLGGKQPKLASVPRRRSD